MAMSMRGGRNGQRIRRRHLLAPRAGVRSRCLDTVSVVHANGKWAAVWGCTAIAPDTEGKSQRTVEALMTAT